MAIMKHIREFVFLISYYLILASIWILNVFISIAGIGSGNKPDLKVGDKEIVPIHSEYRETA
jgi:hypothetical protein